MNSNSLNSESLMIDWLTFNVEGSIDPFIITARFVKYFTPYVYIDNILSIESYGLKKKHKVYIRQWTGTRNHWVGTQIIFSGNNASNFYKLIKTNKINWKALEFESSNVSLGRIDVCFSRANGSNHTTELFDEFLVKSRNQIQNSTNSKHIRLQDFPDGKVLKVNRRNNSIHYRIYQKNQDIRFEMELKHRQTKLIQKHLFNNQFNAFENDLLIRYLKYSKRILYLDDVYTDWIIDFQRRRSQKFKTNAFAATYLKDSICDQNKEKKLFHLFQILSFIESLKLDIIADNRVYKIKTQCYYSVKFSLAQFVAFTGIKISKQSQRDNLIKYFKHLQTLDPMIKEFSDNSFQSYVCFPYVGCENRSGNSWIIEMFVAKELLAYLYPFKLPKSFLISHNKNDLRLKLRFLEALAVFKRKKILNISEFFDQVKVPNSRLVNIKKTILQLLNELLDGEVIHNKIILVFKNGKQKSKLVKKLKVSEVTKRIKYIELYELEAEFGNAFYTNKKKKNR